MSFSIGQMVKKSGLSRSTLLYYHRVGLLSPSGRTSAGYRVYSPGDMQKLEKIIMLRETGMSLHEMMKVIDGMEESGDYPFSASLLKRLGELNSEISACRRQQFLILEMIKNTDSLKNIKQASPAAWSRLLKESGIDQENAKLWHSDFEKYSPAEHKEFLKSIGFSDDEIEGIAGWVLEM